MQPLIMLCAPASPGTIRALLRRIEEDTAVMWSDGSAPTDIDSNSNSIFERVRAIHVSIVDPGEVNTYPVGCLWWDHESPEDATPEDEELLIPVSPFILLMELRRLYPKCQQP